VWINGPYGCGKSTVAGHVLKLLPDSLLLDPEDVGHMLWRQLPSPLRQEEFELEPVWPLLTRTLIEQCAHAYERPLVVPMAVTRGDVFDKIIGGLRQVGLDVHHFTLLADSATIRSRLRMRMAMRREPSDEWGELSWEGVQIERCLRTLAAPKYGIHLWNIDTSAAEIARRIVSYIL
jgi:hypothetical protein